MAEILEKEQFFQLHALKSFLFAERDYCLNDGLLLIKSPEAHRLGLASL